MALVHNVQNTLADVDLRVGVGRIIVWVIGMRSRMGIRFT